MEFRFRPELHSFQTYLQTQDLLVEVLSGLFPNTFLFFSGF